MLRRFVPVFLFLLCLVQPGSALCVRPIANHWMDDTTPTNMSFNLFHLSNRPELTEVYLSFDHSECFAPVSGKHRFVCDGRSVVLYCSESADRQRWEVGLGQASLIWSRFVQLDLDQHHAILHTPDSGTDIRLHSRFTYPEEQKAEFCDRTLRTDSHPLCTKTTTVTWEGETGAVSNALSLELFSGSPNIRLPPTLYADLRQHIANNDKHLVGFSFAWGGQTLHCGENCLWSEGFTSPFLLHAEMGSVSTIKLNNRFLQNHMLVYDAENHSLHLASVPFTKYSPQWKLFSQVFILVKLVAAVWVGTSTTMNLGFTSPCSSINLQKKTLSGAIALMLLIETFAVQYLVMGVAERVLLIVLFFGVFVPLSSPAFFTVFVIQSTFRDLDSYKCVVLLASIQFLILGVLCIQAILHAGKSWWVPLVLLSLAAVVLSLNFQLWVLLFVEEIGSLMGSSRLLMGWLIALVLSVGTVQLVTNITEAEARAIKTV